MTPVTASPEIAQFLSQMRGTAEIRDPQGNILGHYAPFTDEAVGELPLQKKDRKNNLPLKEVFEHLLSVSPDEVRKGILRKNLREKA